MEKYITSSGKEYLLKLGFLNDNNTNNFNFVALGIGDSNAAINQGEHFNEADGYNYTRAQLKIEDSIETTDTSIALSATFDSTNFNPSDNDGKQISEIGIVNQDVESDSQKWFAFLKVPQITKTSNVSLKYTIIIGIE